MTKPGLELHLHTNSDCNLYCKHCYNQSGERSCTDRPSETALLEIIRYFCENYDAEIHLEGGEIFLRPRLLALMNTLPEWILACVTITTNGVIRNEEPETIAMLRKICALRVSVEGHLDEQQQFIRGTPLKPILENAEFYRKEQISVCLRLTLNQRNYDGFIAKTIPSLAARGFSRFQVYEFQSVGRGSENERELALDHPLDALWSEMCTFRLPSGIQFDLMLSAKRGRELQAVAKKLEQHGFVVGKLLPENGISIHADGGVYLCPWDNDPKHQIFNWYQQECPQAYLRSISLKHNCVRCSAFRISPESCKINLG